jgi:adenosyl cobinamide kinase/adenosyl cobinamide phosphate guanylyltransferase
MGMLLLIGGARSGKSSLASDVGETSPDPVVFLATAEGRDEEMADRIRRHRASRPASWRTIEEPLELLDALATVPPEHTVILDCLTLWVSNLLERGVVPSDVEVRARGLSDAGCSRPGRTVVVTNEVGLGIVPGDVDTRTFRDLLGRVNATFASAAEHAALVVAGRLLPLLPADELTRW